MNVQNRTLFEGDNLPVLRGLNSESIDLIATDPPFNKGRDFHATPDSLAAGAKFQDRWRWEADVQGEWVQALQDEEPAAWAVIEWTRMAYGDDMGAFLCFIGVRLLEMRRVLKPTGSIYLHCDDTASHYLKALMDAIFGRANFRNEITWQRTSAHNDAGDYGRVSDRILFYAKSAAAPPAMVRIEQDAKYLETTYRHDDGDGRGHYRLDNLTAAGEIRGRYSLGDLTGAGIRNGESGQPWRGYDPTARGRHWAAPKTGEYAKWIEANHIPGYRDLPGIIARLEALDAHGLIGWSSKGVPSIKRYLASVRGKAATNLWIDVPPIGNRTGEGVGYPTQKPIALYDRIIRASSNEGDWVLDPFAGCATTPIAAELAGRNWIGIDLWDGAAQVTKERLQREVQLHAEGTSVGTLDLGALVHRRDVPVRTDAGEVAAAFLATPTKGQRRPRLMKEHEIKDALIAQFGLLCWGCTFTAPDPRYLELDHVRPRSSGGPDDIDNRALLCGPCNRDKRDGLTLAALRKRNRVKAHPLDLKAAASWTRQAYENAREAAARAR